MVVQLDNQHGWSWRLATFFVVGSLAFLCYANSCWGQFVFDDSEAILNNRDVDPTSTSIFTVFKNDFWGTDISSNTSHKSYRPLTVLTFRANFWLAGLEPFSFHATNVVLHVIVSLLYYETCHLLCLHSSPDRDSKHRTLSPTIAALLFAVHPVHTESVAGIVGRAELMSAICFFLALLCYMKTCDDDTGWCIMAGWLSLTVFLVCCALLFKEQGITVVGVCLVYDIIVHMKGDPMEMLKLEFPLQRVLQWRVVVRVCVLVAASLVMLVFRLSTGSPTFKPIDNAASFADSFLTRVLSYNYIYALNTWLLVTPWWLCFDWSMGCVSLLDSLTDPRLLPLIAFWFSFATVGIYCLRAGKSSLKRLVTMAVVMMVVPFLPASNLFLRVGFVLAERVLYLPSAGYCFLVALGVVTALKHSSKRLVYSGVIFVVTVFTVRSVVRSSQWLTEEDLFTSGASVCPHNAKVLYNIGKVRSDGGDMVTGVAAYREAIRLYPDYDQALNNLANILQGQGKMSEAEELFHRAISANEKFPAAWMNLGIVQVALGKLQEAEKSYLTAIKYRKKYPDAYYNLGNMYVEMEQHNKAIAAYESAIELKKDHISAWNNLGLLYENLNKYGKAEEVLRGAIAQVPHSAQFYLSLGVLLGKQNRLEEGEKLLQRAVALSPTSGLYQANLGVIYHLMKKYKAAEESYTAALRLEPDLKLAQENFKKLISAKNKASQQASYS